MNAFILHNFEKDADAGDLQDAMYAHASAICGDLKLPRPSWLRLRGGDTTKLFDVFDPLRNRWVALTPEEWVRQHFVGFMVARMGCSPLRMANEVKIVLNDMTRRVDTLLYDNLLQPLAVVEYKASSVALTPDVLDQALRYNLVLKAPVIIITNGRDAYTWRAGKLSRGLQPL